MVVTEDLKEHIKDFLLELKDFVIPNFGGPSDILEKEDSEDHDDDFSIGLFISGKEFGYNFWGTTHQITNVDEVSTIRYSVTTTYKTKEVSKDCISWYENREQILRRADKRFVCYRFGLPIVLNFYIKTNINDFDIKTDDDFKNAERRANELLSGLKDSIEKEVLSLRGRAEKIILCSYSHRFSKRFIDKIRITCRIDILNKEKLSIQNIEEKKSPKKIIAKKSTPKKAVKKAAKKSTPKKATKKAVKKLAKKSAPKKARK